MIVKNEAHIIADTLKHLWNYIQFDYWAISDTGSTDQTKEIIKAFFAEKGVPGELQEEAWRDFGYNRTKAFEAAYKKADYAFVWDADDEISGDFKLPADLTADSYKFVFGNAEGMRYSRGQLFSMKKRWCYKGVLHEYAECMEPAGPMVDVPGNYFFISGRRGDRSKDPNKYLKDALVLEKAAEKALAEKDPLYNRYIFYCAQSYNSCNMREKAIEFYKKALTLPLWIQEKYVSCMEIYDKYDELGKPEEGLYYLVESYKHDTTRLECFYRLIKYYCIHGPQEVAYAYYTLVQNFYENHYDGSKLGDKLFAKKGEYDFFLPYYMVIVGERTKNLKTCAKMYEAIFKHQYAFAGEWWIRNLIHNMQFCINDLPDDIGFVNNFFTYMSFLKGKGVKLEPSQLVVVNKMIHRYKLLLGSAPKAHLKLAGTKPSVPIKVMLTMTTCKRWDLFEKTVNSLLHMWTDIDKVDYFFCVDDNSSQRDRTKMKSTFPFIDFYMKRQSERGHRTSMNIIYDMLNTLKPTYWIHMEDDWLFFQKDNYVQKSIDFLDRNEDKDIHQILYNRNYAETYEGWTINGGEAIAGSPGFLIHIKSDSIPGQNCGYWPHYSFRPSMIRTSVILDLGNYDSPNTFFERDYADKYFARGYKSAFFDTVCCLHTGKLTSDKTGTNAYTLNKTGQFNGASSKKQQASTFIVNLLRRTDRKEAMEVEFEKAGLDEDYEFFEAVDGKDLVLTDEINTLFLGNDFGSRKGVIGCALSHYALWKQLVASESEYYTIFEDDVKLSDKFKAKWEEACKSESDITFLGFTSRDRAVRTTEGATPLVELDLGKYIGGFFGYIIRKAAAKKLVEYISQKGIKHGIDYLVKVVPGLKCSAVQPHVLQTEWFSSSESKVDTDIQKDYSSLQIQATVNEAEWDFYEGVDSGGSDIVRSESRDPKGLMAAAASHSECVAFNTLGYLKSRVKFPLIKSPWLHAPNGVYVKKGYKPSIRVKMLCNWCSSEDLCKEWLKMCKGANTYKWNDLEITWSDEDIDYYVIINKPRPGDKYIAEKSIIYHMEPWCAGKDQGWGIKTWGSWANPDPKLFLQVRTHDRFVNTVFWQLNLTYDQLQTMDMEAQKNPTLDKVLSTICSSKYHDPGHKKRIDFLHYLEKKGFPLHIYNEDNERGFKSYQGKARPSVDKEKGLVPYKYYFMCENNAERNFVTEKLWEPILCESLCFYWGCPNVADIVDPRAYVQLDMNDFESAYNTINAAIQMNLWEERLPYIKAAKQKILENSFFPILEKVLKPKTVCFIHSCHLQSSGTEKLDLVLDAVLKVKELEVITINNIGLKLDHAKYEAIDPRIMVIHCSDNSQEFELPTLRLMHEFSLNSPNTKVLYVHSKGISYAKNDYRYEPGLDWINYMLHFLCEKSEHCLKLLDTHDVAGCNFSETPKPHFSGNFWWATTKYLKGLDTALLTDKMSAEWWLQSNPVKPVKAVLWNSGKNHFHERYPRELYFTEFISLDMCLTSITKDKNGIEIGGPSRHIAGAIYKNANLMDNVIFSSDTVWSKHASREYKYYDKKVGRVFINDAVNISDVSNSSYDFIFSSHSLEHIANPIKALKEWLRILRDDGHIILILPDKNTCFDHKREYSKISTLISQYEKDVGEDDLSTLPEILENHDLSKDPPAGNLEQFKKRSLDNYNNRCLHHYVYNEQLLNDITTYLKCKFIYTKNENGNIWYIMKKQTKRSLVVYVYSATDPSDYNLKFFSKAAISYSENIDYIIVVNGHLCRVELPQLANLTVIYRDNVGFDFAGHKAALDSLNGKKYDYYFFLNSSVLGPFYHEEPKVHWTELFTRRITDKVKLVGTCIFCIPSSHPVYSGPLVEGFFYLTDEVGLNLLLNRPSIYLNYELKADSVHNGEFAITRCILENGYSIDCMLEKFQGVDWLDKSNWSFNSCEPPSRRGKYFGGSIDPFEVIFHKWYWHNPNDSMVSFDIVDNYVKNYKKYNCVCFIHSCNIVNIGTDKLDLVLSYIIKIKELDAIFINNIGLPLDNIKYKALDNRIKIIQCSSDITLYELPTLKMISSFSKENANVKLLYVHTKGISYKESDPRYLPILDWIKYMLHFLCNKSDNCLELLDIYDTLGCDYLDTKWPPHFSGNFWWATTNYIKTLKTDSLVDKMSAEWWILSGNSNKYVLYDTKRDEHYWTRHTEEEYIKDT
jgi:GR25 family glycosyltransferase involved in LPS biosynthesis/SAM-dependent methyltransferase/tetratricopeptide (TPR) repeat protein